MTFDVDHRLSEARPAVGNTQDYVAACRALGYQNPDLTAHDAQILEWFSGEDGLDLAVLDADCARLLEAIAAAEDVTRMEHEALDSIITVWEGGSGSVAADFVQRHCRAGAATLASLRSASEACAALRDILWRAVDAKAAGAIAIDDRRAGERGAWLTAAHTVTGGGRDRSASVDIVEKAIMPYVDSDIRTEWVGSMRLAIATVDTAFRDAIGRIQHCATVDFEVPSQILPTPRTSDSGGDSALASEPYFAPPQAGPADPMVVRGAARETLAMAPDPAGIAPTALGTLPPPMTSPTGLPGGLPAGPDPAASLPGRSDPLFGPVGGPDEPGPPDNGMERSGRDRANEGGAAEDGAAEDDADEADADEDDEPDPDTDGQADDQIANQTGDPVPEPNNPAVTPLGEAEAEAGGLPSEAAGEPNPQALPVAQEPSEPLADAGNTATPCEIAADALPQVGQ